MTAPRAPLAAAVAVALAVAGCGGPGIDPTTGGVAPAPPTGNKVFDTGWGGGVWKVIDRKAGVVCWVYANGYQGGIACLPCADVATGTCDGGGEVGR